MMISPTWIRGPTLVNALGLNSIINGPDTDSFFLLTVMPSQNLPPLLAYLGRVKERAHKNFKWPVHNFGPILAHQSVKNVHLRGVWTCGMFSCSYTQFWKIGIIF